MNWHDFNNKRILGEVPVAEVDRALVLKVVKPIWNDKTETAKRVKDRIKLGNCVVSNPDVDDSGPSGDHMCTLNFSAMYAAGDTAAIVWTRLVA